MTEVEKLANEIHKLESRVLVESSRRELMAEQIRTYRLMCHVFEGAAVACLILAGVIIYAR